MKIKLFPRISLVLSFAFITCAPTQPFDVAAEKATIQTVIETSIGWALTKDKQALYDAVARDSAFFIINPDSSAVDGFAEFRNVVENFFMLDDFKATHFEVKQLRIHISQSGDAAWYSAVLDDFGEFKGRSTSWNNVRWTGVLEKRDSRWVIVQMHFSFPK
ncbi:MAG: nuclear transport factor 2 family protein [Candidatus Zhuqueibacterota bacterium]